MFELFAAWVVLIKVVVFVNNVVFVNVVVEFSVCSNLAVVAVIVLNEGIVFGFTQLNIEMKMSVVGLDNKLDLFFIFNLIL